MKYVNSSFRELVDAADHGNSSFHFEPELELFKTATTAENLYVSPWDHSAVYYIGMLIGYYLHENNKTLQMKKVLKNNLLLFQ